MKKTLVSFACTAVLSMSIAGAGFAATGMDGVNGAGTTTNGIERSGKNMMNRTTDMMDQGRDMMRTGTGTMGTRGTTNTGNTNRMNTNMNGRDNYRTNSVTNNNGTGTYRAANTTGNNDRGSNWGWLGLLGLLGLAGMRNRAGSERR